LIPSPIRTVLSSIRKNRVQALLMGGQACVLYGAAQFSRDTDLAILAEPGNLALLQAALDELHAEVIAVPPFEQAYLEMGLAVHFRCHAAGCEGIRIDVMATMRGVDEFAALWARRTTIQTDDGEYELLALPDLVRAKKTQRAKDWPMIKALVDTNYFENRASPSPEQIQFWLQELRTPEWLCSAAQAHAAVTRPLQCLRPLLSLALAGDLAAVERELALEEQRERDADRVYWRPLRAELERLRRMRRSGEGSDA
jgi:hypothetical protein